MTYLPFEPGPHRLQMGLMALKPEDWIELDETLGAILLAKRRLLAERHGEVFAAMPDTEAAGAEVLALLADHLPRRFPTQYPRMNTTIAVAATGELIGIGAPGVHPLETAARLVPEDLCLMRRTDAGYILAAACVCFPSRWRLADKIGRSLAAIHGPVPGYGDGARPPGRPLLREALVDKPVWRLNWTIHARSEPFQPVAPKIGRSTPAEFAESVFLRIERQTLRRLPASARRAVHHPHLYPAAGRDRAGCRRPRSGSPPPSRTCRRPMRAYRSMTTFADELVGMAARSAALARELIRERRDIGGDQGGLLPMHGVAGAGIDREAGIPMDAASDLLLAPLRQQRVAIAPDHERGCRDPVELAARRPPASVPPAPRARPAPAA